MKKKFLFMLWFLSSLEVNAFDEKISLKAEEADIGVLVYVINTTSGEVNIKNTLNLRGKGSSLSPVSLSVKNENGVEFGAVMIVDPADEATCLKLRPNAIHGIVYRHEYIKKMFHLDPGVYQIKAIYNDFFCKKSIRQK